ncbi:hypothetical protein ACWGH6_38455, partial [Streptomyces xanthophaeus]
MRIRPYVTLPDPAGHDEPEPAPAAPPMLGVVAPDPDLGRTPAYGMPVPPDPGGTPAYGMPVAPGQQPWPQGPAGGPYASGTARVPAVPAAQASPAGVGGPGSPGGSGSRGGAPRSRKGAHRAFQGVVPLMVAAAALIGVAGTALALWAFPASSGGELTMLDGVPSAAPPVASTAPAGPSRPASPGPGSASPS